MIKYPLFFKVQASSPQGISHNWTSSATNLKAVDCSIPKEFMGPGSGYSPEDFMAMAVANCFIATFKVFAEKAHLSFETIHVEATISIDRLPQGTVGASSLEMNISLKGAQDSAKADLILQEAKKNCLMANALKLDVRFNMRTI